MKRLLIISLVIISIGNSMCWAANQPLKPCEKQISVVTTIEPLATFIENVGKDHVSVTVMVPSNANPHTYEPTPQQLQALQTAQLYVKVGTGIEFELVWMQKLQALNRNMKVCDSSVGISLLQAQKDHAHGHGQVDPHIWLSPVNAHTMVNNILKQLILIDPRHQEAYHKNAAQYIKKLTQLDEYAHKTLAGLHNRNFIVVHPAWAYFAHEYGLHEYAIEHEGKETTAKHLLEIVKTAQQLHCKCVFVSPQFSQRSAKMIAHQINGRVIVVDQLSPDYIKTIRYFVNEIIKNDHE